MGSVTITDDSVLTLKDGSTIKLREDSALTVTSIDNVKNIDPVAVHLKEVNHIDPFSIDSLHVSEVKNIDPIEITRFNVTNLPMVNVSLQKLPAVDFNVKTLPPVSVGTHQNFCIPSDYTLRARVLGVELIRLHLNGTTSIIPKERARREQARSDNRSFAQVAAAGNPAIPSRCEPSSDGSCQPKTAATNYKPALPSAMLNAAQNYAAPVAYQAGMTSAGNINNNSVNSNSSNSNSAAPVNAQATMGTLSFGMPRAAFQFPNTAADTMVSDNRLMSGE